MTLCWPQWWSQVHWDSILRLWSKPLQHRTCHSIEVAEVMGCNPHGQMYTLAARLREWNLLEWCQFREKLICVIEKWSQKCLGNPGSRPDPWAFQWSDPFKLNCHHLQPVSPTKSMPTTIYSNMSKRQGNQKLYEKSTPKGHSKLFKWDYNKPIKLFSAVRLKGPLKIMTLNPLSWPTTTTLPALLYTGTMRGTVKQDHSWAVERRFYHWSSCNGLNG